VGALEALLGSQALQVGEVALDQYRRRIESAQLGSRHLHGGCVAIDAQKPAAWLHAFQQGTGVTARPHRAVDDDRARTGLKDFYYLL
jgi:hypothetical protein